MKTFNQILEQANKQNELKKQAWIKFSRATTDAESAPAYRRYMELVDEVNELCDKLRVASH